MKIAVFSDVHDNLERWREAAEIIDVENIKVGICCGDVADIEVLREIAKSFKKLYLCFGNFDYKLKNKTDFFPKNVEWFSNTGEFSLQRVAPSAGSGERKIAINHYDYNAKKLAESGKYDIVFYGHTHTPWEEKIGNTVLLNPGEVSGQFGKATFAIYDLEKMKAELKILR